MAAAIRITSPASSSGTLKPTKASPGISKVILLFLAFRVLALAISPLLQNADIPLRDEGTFY
jgi:hypothetical protein